MDTGPVYAVCRTPIGADEDAGTLSARLARDGAALLVDDASRGSPRARPRRSAAGRRARDRSARRSAARTAGPTSPRPAIELVRRLRAFTPWPGLFAFRGGRRVKLLAARDGRRAAQGPRRARSWRPETRSSSRAARGRSR